MKRANGTGTVVKMSGTRRRPYAVKVSSRDKYGQVKQVVLSYHEKASEAQAALDEYNKNLREGKAPAADKLSMTVGQIFDLYKAREYRHLNPQSISSRNVAWKMRVSRFADRKIRDVTLDDWQSILDEDEENGLSQSSINNDAMLIRHLCEYSMMRDIIVKDYSQYLKIPSVGAKVKKDALSDTQIAKLFQMAEEGVPWADTVLILCYTGFRINEFLSLTPFSYHPENGGYLQGGMKTEAGKNRIVPLHPKIKPFVLNWLKKNGEAIICNSNGKPFSTMGYRRHFNRIAEIIGVPNASPHWCRHTFATLLHNAKTDPLTVKWLMGHSTKSDITEHYTHESIAALVEAINQIA